MTARNTIRSLAVCLIGAAIAFAPQTASARHWGHYRGGFGGGWGHRGGFYGGGWGRGFYRGGLYRGFGFYPRAYAGFYPRFYRRYYPGFYGGFYPSLYGGYYGGYYPGAWGGSYGYPAYSVGYGNGGYGLVCANYGLNSGYVLNNSGSGTATVVSSPSVSAGAAVVTAAPRATTTQPNSTNATFAYYLKNNPYRQQADERIVSPSELIKTASFNPYATTSRMRITTKAVDGPPAPGL